MAGLIGVYVAPIDVGLAWHRLKRQGQLQLRRIAAIFAILLLTKAESKGDRK
jgi:hypothetical protein